MEEENNVLMVSNNDYRSRFPMHLMHIWSQIISNFYLLFISFNYFPTFLVDYGSFTKVTRLTVNMILLNLISSMVFYSKDVEILMFDEVM